MKQLKKIKIKSHIDKTGKLIPLTFDKKFPIRVKRIFFLQGKKNKIRGNHAHKKCYQLFIPILGKFVLKIQTPNTNKKILLNHKSNDAFLVPPKFWCTIKFLNKESILMVACNLRYNASDYIRNFEKYKKYLGKK